MQFFYRILISALAIPTSWVYPLTLEQKVGAIFMAGFEVTEQPEVIAEAVKKFHLGGIMFSAEHGKAPREHVQKLITAARAVNPTILVGFDAEWGISQRCSNTHVYPRAGTLGTENNLQYTYDTAYAIGCEARGLGVTILFAPVLDVNTNPDNPIIGTRSFGNTPELVIAHADAFIRGLKDAGVIPCIKHFPGHGDTHIDSHVGLPTVTHPLERLEQIELAPFKTLHRTSPALMIAHLLVPALAPDTPTSLSHTVITELLRNQWDYTGVIVTDALNMGALTKHYTPEDIALQAFKAGNDILLYPGDLGRAYRALLTAVLTGKISEESIDKRLARIAKIRK